MTVTNPCIPIFRMIALWRLFIENVGQARHNFFRATFNPQLFRKAFSRGGAGWIGKVDTDLSG